MAVTRLLRSIKKKKSSVSGKEKAQSLAKKRIVKKKVEAKKTAVKKAVKSIVPSAIKGAKGVVKTAGKVSKKIVTPKRLKAGLKAVATDATGLTALRTLKRRKKK